MQNCFLTEHAQWICLRLKLLSIVSFAFHSYYLLVRASCWFFPLWYFRLSSRKKWQFLPTLWLFCTTAHSHFVPKELFSCQIQMLKLVRAVKRERTPLKPASPYGGSQTCTSCTCRHGASEPVPTLPGPARSCQHGHGCAPWTHHPGLGPPMGLCLYFLPSSKVLPSAVNTSKLGQDIQRARLSCAQISKAEPDLWEGFF